MIKPQSFLSALVFLCAITLSSAHAQSSAGGVGLGATRIIYHQDQEQVTLPVRNSDSTTRFLIQSWVDDASGLKTKDFIVTPPLFMLNPQRENSLRVVYNGKKTLANDRETIYWINVKAIPGVNAKEKNSNSLQIAVQNRIRLLVRPANLPIPASDAPNKLQFALNGANLVIHNNSPYYLSLVNIHVGSLKLPNTTAAPLNDTTVKLPSAVKGDITFQTVNDYGANTPMMHGKM